METALITEALSRCRVPWRPKFAPASLLPIGGANGGLVGGGGRIWDVVGWGGGEKHAYPF